MWIHFGAVVLGIFVLVIRYWKGLVTKETTSITGWFTLVLFQGVNFLSGSIFEQFSRSSAILLAFAIFLLLFWKAYQHASKRY